MKEIVFAGFGGQGVLTAGLIASQIALYSGYNATWMPSYGATMRGGTANCTVKFGAEMIYCPAQEEPDVVLAMNAPSLKKFAPIIARNGILVYNSDMIKEEDLAGVRSDIKVVAVPCLHLADQVKNQKGANIIMIGVIMKLLGEFGHDACVDGMNDMFRKKGKAKHEAGNTAAFDVGYNFV